MNILLIGGPKFLGRHITFSALAAGRSVTHFNRGHYSTDEFSEFETIIGDRYKDLDKLAGRRWDAVIDTCGYLPQNVRETAEALKNSVERYIFVSSISAYAETLKPNLDESTPLAELTTEQRERVAAIDVSGDITALKLQDMYGALKADCERELESAMPGRAVMVRSGLLVGPHDTTDRFTYWVMRTAKGSEVLAPGNPARFVQLIDVRDIADWLVKMAESGEAGAYNVTGTPFDLSMGAILEAIKMESGSDAIFTWANEEFLVAENVNPWSEMPLYLPESDEESRGFLSVNIDRAIGQGLKCRPFNETVRDTLRWVNENLSDKTLKAGISFEREVELLEKFRIKRG